MLSLGAQEFGERPVGELESRVSAGRQACPRRLSDRFTRDLVRPVEPGSRCMGQRERDLVDVAQFEKTPKQLRHVLSLGVPRRPRGICHHVVGFDKKAASLESFAPHLNHPIDAEEFTPVYGAPLLGRCEHERRLFFHSVEVDELATREIGCIGARLHRSRGPHRNVERHAIAAFKVFVPPGEVAPETDWHDHRPPPPGAGGDSPTPPVDDEAGK